MTEEGIRVSALIERIVSPVWIGLCLASFAIAVAISLRARRLDVSGHGGWVMPPFFTRQREGFFRLLAYVFLAKPQDPLVLWLLRAWRVVLLLLAGLFVGLVGLGFYSRLV